MQRFFLMQKVFLFVQFLLMGAVPFHKDVPRLKQLGVGGVITLNEPYETLVPSSLYNVGSMAPHLVFLIFFCLPVGNLMIASCFRLMKWSI